MKYNGRNRNDGSSDSKAIDLTRASFARKQEAPTPIIEQAKTMIIPAEEQREFEDYAKALITDPTSQIHKRLNAEYDIGQIDFDPSETEFDDNALLYHTSMMKLLLNLRKCGLTLPCHTLKLFHRNMKEILKMN